MRLWMMVVSFGWASLAWSQTAGAPATPPPAAAEMPPPPNESAAPTPPPNAPSPDSATAPSAVTHAIPSTFNDQFLAWDPTLKTAVQGRQHTVLTREQFFTELGRPDLIDQSAHQRIKRITFIVLGAAGLVAGVIAGTLLIANQPDLNSPACGVQTNDTFVYNACVDRQKLYSGLGGGSFAAGAVVATLFWTLAYWSDPDVLDADEAQRLISSHNASLLKKLRAGAFLSPVQGGAMLGTALNF